MYHLCYFLSIFIIILANASGDFKIDKDNSDDMIEHEMCKYTKIWTKSSNIGNTCFYIFLQGTCAAASFQIAGARYLYTVNCG